MKQSIWKRTWAVYREVIEFWKSDPVIWGLIGATAVMDAVALAVLYFAPCPPFSYFLAPIIRTFWNERFLHYPDNFLLLPKLFAHAHFLIASVIGVFFSGLLVKKMEARVRGGAVTVVQASRAVFRKYFSLFFAWIFSYGLFTYALKVIMPLIHGSVWVQTGCAFLFGLFFQTLVAFVLPAVLTAPEGFLKSFLGALRFALANLGPTSVLLCAPVFVVVAFSFLKSVAPLYLRVYPEVVLWVLFAGIGVLSFVDLFVTSVTACVYIKNGVKHEITVG